MQRHDETWIGHLAAHGYPGAEPLAAGMEGAVYALGDDLVAKVWGTRGATDLERLRLFYEDLSGLSIATPRIERVLSVDGRFATVERRLHGTPLSEMEPYRPEHWPKAVRAMADVLEQLSAAGDTPALRGLPVLAEPHPFWAGGRTWPQALAALVARKRALFQEPLRT